MNTKFSLILALISINLASAAVIRRQGTGTQFITGPCKSDADCGSGCCAFTTGKCAGAIVALERDGGCGFGNPTPNDDAARKLRGQPPRAPGDVFVPPGGAAAPPANNGGAGGAAGSGKAPGTQFITGPCANDGECDSGCCGFKTGKCAGAIVALERDGGCGFGNPAPNDDAARKLRGQPPRAANDPFTPPGGAAAPPANNGGAAGGAAGSGKPPGTQFITGPCANDGECDSGCCGFKTGKCAGAIIAQERDGGCGFGNPTPNDDAARKLRGQARRSVEARQAAGTQFVTGPCTADAECETGCCGFKTGKCAGAIIALERDGGCGFGNATPNDDAARKLRGQPPRAPGDVFVPAGGAPAAPPANNGAATGGAVGGARAPGSQTITQPCASDAECDTACCGFNTGICAGPRLAQIRDGGCGFGNATPNDDAVRKTRGQA
ncbi:hypothetical protein PQX77_006622 [Marasmius sp. AFHP31]|nr:hypothetical protein PQX77_006622 [Marasmius sp. AFHP31]